MTKKHKMNLEDKKINLYEKRERERERERKKEVKPYDNQRGLKSR